MEITFGTTKLRRAYENHADATRAWGEKIGRRYLQRVNEIYAAENARALGQIPAARLHPLKAGRRGEYAVNLDETWRLIMVFTDDARTQVTLKEVSNHYGD